jgi:hypothetical protein
MIEEGNLLKMSHSVLHDNPLATATGKSETSSDNSMASKRSSESQLQGDIKHQKTYELEASEEKKNIQASAEFWAVMRHTHGFQHQPTGPQVQAMAANEVAPCTELGTSSRQQAEAFLELQRNPKRRRGSDEEYTDTTNQIMGRPAKRNKEFTGEHAKTNTTTTPHGDTSASGSGDATSLTSEYTKPNTSETPQGHNLDGGHRDKASLPAIDEEKNVRAITAFWNVRQTTHGFQNQTASTNEVTPKTESGTSSRHQAEASLENPRHHKRKRGSDGEYTESGKVLSSSTTAATLGDIDTLTDTATSRPNNKRCIQVERETYAVTSQPGTPYTFDPGTDAGTILGQRLHRLQNQSASANEVTPNTDPGIFQTTSGRLRTDLSYTTVTIRGTRRRPEDFGS